MAIASVAVPVYRMGDVVWPPKLSVKKVWPGIALVKTMDCEPALAGAAPSGGGVQRIAEGQRALVDVGGAAIGVGVGAVERQVAAAAHEEVGGWIGAHGTERAARGDRDHLGRRQRSIVNLDRGGIASRDFVGHEEIVEEEIDDRARTGENGVAGGVERGELLHAIDITNELPGRAVARDDQINRSIGGKAPEGPISPGYSSSAVPNS